MTRHALTDEQVDVVRTLCEALVPGSAAVGPETFVDSLAADAPEDMRAALFGAIAELEPVRDRGAAFLAEVQDTPSFELMRALAIDAYYSDFAAPGHEGPTAWEAIDFNSPQALRLSKDWSFLRSHR